MDDTELLEELQDRISVIEKLPWTEIAELGKRFGVAKPEDENWKQQAEKIAIAEAKAAAADEELEAAAEKGQTEEVEPTSESVASSEPDKPSYDLIRSGGIMKCPVCNQLVRTGLVGQLICPIKDGSCPRHSE